MSTAIIRCESVGVHRSNGGVHRSGRKRPGGGETRFVAGGNRARARSRPHSPRGRASPGRLRKEGARAASAVVPIERSAAGDRLELARFAPSGRSLLTGLLILLTAVGLYAAARTTSAFAVERIAVDGASPEVAAQVRAALVPAVGESLLGMDLASLAQRAQNVPMVAAATIDRGFPHTLRITVVPESPVAVLRQGAFSWLAADGGRVVAELGKGARPGLPRIWLKRDVEIVLGERVAGLPLRAITAVAPLRARPLPVAVASVAVAERELTLVLRNGLSLRLGSTSDLAVKLEIARRIVGEPDLVADSNYLDLSVPERPVAGTTLDSQVEVESSASTVP
jgi:cell division septal protein FtsQ